MPLTTSHPAAAWLVRRVAPRLPLDALVLGTMAPDFEYILRLRVYGRFAHTPLGLLLFCLPTGLAACLLFRALVRPALARHLPPGMRRRVTFSDGRWAASGVAVLAGAVTHVFWDGVTHGTASLVVEVPALRASLGGARVYTLLQHLSTLVGAAAILLWLRSWARSYAPDDRRYPPGGLVAAVRVAAFILAFAASCAVLNGARRVHRGLAPTLGYAAVGGMAGLAAAAVAYGVAVRARRAPVR